MEKKKGFTLIELLAVIVILVSMSLVVVTSVSSSLERRDVKECEEQIELAKNAAKIYFSLNDVCDFSDSSNSCMVGIQTLKDGNYFKGNFINGQMNGLGLFVWNDGSKYYGYYKNNVKEGKGKFIWPDGKCFEGNFLNGQPHGKGIITITDENKKIISSNEVEYENGKLI